MQHRGEIVEQAVRQSGYPISKLALKMGKSRRWMYLMFDNAQVSFETIIAIGEVIHHDFSDEIKELKQIDSENIFREKQMEYATKNSEVDYWKDKYYALLEEYNQLLKKG